MILINELYTLVFICFCSDRKFVTERTEASEGPASAGPHSRTLDDVCIYIMCMLHMLLLGCCCLYLHNLFQLYISTFLLYCQSCDQLE